MSNKFKVGDKVRVILGESTPSLSWYDGMTEYVGGEFEVRSISDEGAYDLSGVRYFMHESWLGSVEDKFKAGDLVQILKGESVEGECSWASPYMDEYDGQIARVVRRDRGEFTNYILDGITWNFHETWLKPFKFDGFEVGDAVICIVENKYTTTNENTVCEVTKVYKDVITLKTISGEMHDEQNKNVYRVFSEDFKLLSRKPKPDTSKGDVIRDGDLIICKDGHNYEYTGQNTLCRVKFASYNPDRFYSDFVNVVTGIGKYRMLKDSINDDHVFPVSLSHFEKVYTDGKFDIDSIVVNNLAAKTDVSKYRVLGYLKSGNMLVELDNGNLSDHYYSYWCGGNPETHGGVRIVNPEDFSLFDCTPDTPEKKTRYSQHLPRSEQTTPELIGECISLVKQMDRMKERLHNKRDFLKGNIEEINSRTGIDITQYVKELDGVIV